jgi:DNA repair protein RecO (recombination protein O)
MPARLSESFILQSWPFREGDLVVSFLTRDQGKVRGVARRARRPKSGFGSGFERLSHVKLSYFQKENRELVSIDGIELLQSQFAVVSDFTAACALDYLAEVSEQILPAMEPSEKHFRLLAAVLEHMRGGEPGAIWRGVTYFSLWAVRLAGFLPELEACSECGIALDSSESPERMFYSRFRNGLMCVNCKRTASSTYELDAESLEIAKDMLRTPVGQLRERAWSQATALSLRRFLGQQIESHIERKLVTLKLLEAAA